MLDASLSPAALTSLLASVFLPPMPPSPTSPARTVKCLPRPPRTPYPGSLPPTHPAGPSDDRLATIDAAFLHMDAAHGSSFRQFLRDPTTAAYCAQRIAPLVRTMDVPTTAAGLRYLLAPWPTEARVTFLRFLFRDSHPERAGALYAAILWPSERTSEGPTDEFIALAAGALVGATIPAAAVFLWVWRWVCGLGDLPRVLPRVASILQWEPREVVAALRIAADLDNDRRYERLSGAETPNRIRFPRASKDLLWE